MQKSERTKSKIIEVCIDLLGEKGSEGVTMRKVAVAAGISLGNLQYHFRNKSELLRGVITFYFKVCSDLLESYSAPTDSASTIERLEHFCRWMLDHFGELTPMCRMFREIWAISSRDPDIDALMDHYYAEYTKALTRGLNALGMTSDAAALAADFMVPFFEGYSITGTQSDLSLDQQAKRLANLMLRT